LEEGTAGGGKLGRDRQLELQATPSSHRRILRRTEKAESRGHDPDDRCNPTGPGKLIWRCSAGLGKMGNSNYTGPASAQFANGRPAYRNKGVSDYLGKTSRDLVFNRAFRTCVQADVRSRSGCIPARLAL